MAEQSTDISEIYIKSNTSKCYVWKPQKDITPYELALCVPIFSYPADWVFSGVESLPAEAIRHFEEVK